MGGIGSWNSCTETQEDAMKSESVSTKRQRIAALAKLHPQLSFTSLAYYIDYEWLHAAYEQTRKDGAVGVDKVTATEYASNLEANLHSLLDRFKSGTYTAPPVRRTYIPKAPSSEELRPLGIPTFEDKVLQRAVLMVLEPLYETDFLSVSYGYRPKRSAHQALETLWRATMRMGGGTILEVDIRNFFGTLQHKYLRDFVKRRVCDGVLVRIIGKWLKAGVMENGLVHYDEDGTPQGGVISPLLSNVYLHYVLDKWFTEEIMPRISGQAELVRFADDFVIVFQNKHDALRVERVLHKRFEKFGLKLHEEKTRLIDFYKPRNTNAHRKESWDFLGFTHYWGKSKSGRDTVKRKTSAKKLARALKAINVWCREHMHDELHSQSKKLSQKLRGHYGYFGITFNSRSIDQMYQRVQYIWWKWLNRRGGKKMSPETFNKLLEKYPLPVPRIVHKFA